MNKQNKNSHEKLVCFCYSVSKQTIIDAIENDGANSIMDIRVMTYANTGCRGCIEDIRRLLKKHVKIREDKKAKHDKETNEGKESGSETPDSDPNASSR